MNFAPQGCALPLFYNRCHNRTIIEYLDHQDDTQVTKLNTVYLRGPGVKVRAPACGACLTRFDSCNQWLPRAKGGRIEPDLTIARSSASKNVV